ncbi:hypothetical protein K435DRAFT_772744 [Dendrothele bispora CBS 962.96]|uniref:Endonuclease/exonuclease/phosphatase domain-containing protein n=1 Tax=Dendrothele bispora (strain CBS 962.96) TaxID=1314807 RepID=A0A4S8MVU7_DENBC|nr:hypothetical protein K435DRAFT_772744 [Dendrothele bispora CBS 962.96]
MSVHEEAKNSLWPLKMYRYRQGSERWKHVPKDYSSNTHPSSPDRIRILTWNLDCSSPHAIDRMQGAMMFLQEVLEDPPLPCVVLLQEVHQDVLPYLLAVDWVRNWFLVTPASKVKWNGKGTYGLITLVEKSIAVMQSSIVHFARNVVTEMDRAVVITDVKLRVPAVDEGEEGDHLVVRIANVHLESTGYWQAADRRRAQLKFCSWMVQNYEDAFYPFDGGVVAGDFNAIDVDSDVQVLQERLVDLGTKMGVQEQHTWGVNETRTRGGYPPGRLDKIIFTPDRGFRLTVPERVGVGLTVESLGREVCVSDHCALSCDLEVQRNG